MSTYADDVRYDWSREQMFRHGGEALLVAHPPGSPGREAVIHAGLGALAEVDADIVTVGMRLGLWPMSTDGWPHAAGHETHTEIRHRHVRAAMDAAIMAL